MKIIELLSWRRLQPYDPMVYAQWGLLMGSLLLLSLGIARPFLFPIKEVSYEKEKESSDIAKLSNAEPLELKTLDFYQNLFASKRLFRPLISSDMGTVVALTIDDFAREFILSGIIKQEDPEAIVKNQRTQQSFFVRKGASLGQLKVEEVAEEYIVVSYEGTSKKLFIQ